MVFQQIKSFHMIKIKNNERSKHISNNNNDNKKWDNVSNNRLIVYDKDNRNE